MLLLDSEALYLVTEVIVVLCVMILICTHTHTHTPCIYTDFTNVFYHSGECLRGRSEVLYEFIRRSLF